MKSNIIFIIIMLIMSLGWFHFYNSPKESNFFGNCEELPNFEQGQVLTAEQLNVLVCHIDKLERK